MDLKYYKRLCKDIENVENYEKAKADDFENWACHHRKGEYIPRKELKALGMYYGVSADELVFLLESEHRTLHKKGNQHHKGKKHSEETKNKMSKVKKGKRHTDEAKNKMSEAAKGRTPWNKGKKCKPLSEEHKKKIGEASKNMSKETRKKIGENSKGRHWYNNGKVNKFCYDCPEGFVPGMLLN